MRIKEILWQQYYKEFDIGEWVIPSSTRCSLTPGRYKVIGFKPPLYLGDPGWVTIEGRESPVAITYLESESK
mgnify:CR=1 FL=1